MTLNASLPRDTDFASELPKTLRETRRDVNLIWAALANVGAVSSARNLTVSGGQTALVVGTDVGDVMLEVVFIGSAAAESVHAIEDGTHGQIKIFVAANDNVTFVHNASYIALNGESDLNIQTGDSLALVNVDGNPSSGVDGVWKEIFRSVLI